MKVNTNNKLFVIMSHTLTDEQICKSIDTEEMHNNSTNNDDDDYNFDDDDYL